MYLLSATITQNILEYIWVLLELFPPLSIYKQLHNWPNLIYIVNSIRKIVFKDLEFLLLSRDVIGKILKTRIFVNKIGITIQIAKHLCSRLLKYIWREKHSNYIVPIFTANLTTILKTQLLADFCLDKSQIWICTKYASMYTNLSDIPCDMQFKISGYIMLSKFL